MRRMPLLARAVLCTAVGAHDGVTSTPVVHCAEASSALRVAKSEVAFEFVMPNHLSMLRAMVAMTGSGRAWQCKDAILLDRRSAVGRGGAPRSATFCGRGSARISSSADFADLQLRNLFLRGGNFCVAAPWLRAPFWVSGPFRMIQFGRAKSPLCARTRSADCHADCLVSAHAAALRATTETPKTNVGFASLHVGTHIPLEGVYFPPLEAVSSSSTRGTPPLPGKS